MSDLPDRIKRHLNQMAPHIRERATSVLLEEAADEIRQLEDLCRVLAEEPA